MKFIYLLVTLMSVNWAVAQNFEGVITLNTTNEEMKEKASVTWYLKGAKSRMDISSQAGDHATEYVVIADEKGMDLIAEGHITPVPQAAMQVDVTGQTLVSETDGGNVNGFNCKKVVYTDGTNQTTYWLADGLGITFNDLPFVIKRNMPKITTDGFPVKMEKRNKDGKVVMTQDVTAVRASTVDDSKFERR